MKVPHIKPIIAGMIAVAGIISCADSSGLSSDQRKDAKKDRPTGDNANISNSNTDATQPQVVTGAYLTCVADSTIPDALPGETSYGCGVYDPKTHAKIDMTNRSMQLATSDTSGQPTASRSAEAGASSPYMKYLYTDTHTTQIKAGIFGASNVQLFSATMSPIIVNNLSDGFDLKNRPAGEVDAWCSVITQVPDDFSNNQLMFSKVAACGPQYLCSHKGYNTSFAGISCIIDTGSQILGALKAIFNGGSSSNVSAGACLDQRIPGNMLYAQYCK